MNKSKRRNFAYFSERRFLKWACQNKVKNIGKGVSVLALVCPRYIVRGIFREADTFNTFVS